MIKLGSRDLDMAGISWVASCIDAHHKDIARHYLLFTGRHFIATDGARLHFYRPDLNFEAGLYEVVKRTKASLVLFKSEDPALVFPEWKRCFPKSKPTTKFTIWGDTVNHNAAALAEVIRALPETVCINPKYLADVLGARTFKVSIYDERKLILFSAKRYTALLMAILI